MALCGLPEHEAERPNLGDISHAGKLFQGVLRGAREGARACPPSGRTTLSVCPLAWMRCRSYRNARVAGSKPSRFSSSRAVRNWMVKNGLPWVFSKTSSESGLALSG